MSEVSQTEISYWLQTVFGTKFNIEIEGTTDKSDGYSGSVIFVKAQNNESVKYLVLKCAKTNQTLRQLMPIRDIYRNEIYMYENIFAAFQSFERERGITHPFNKFPRFYGSFITDSIEVVMLENLCKRNFALHDFSQSFTKDEIELVLKSYGHFHAVSVSMRDQQPEKFQELIRNLLPVWDSFCKAANFPKMFGESLAQCYELLNGQISEDAMNEWKQFRDHIEDTLAINGKTDRFTVLIHGDCWNNNFLLKETPAGCSSEDVAILDWQISSLSTPVIDVSYFLFASVAIEDLKNINSYLKIYYESFTHSVQQLGSDPARLYAFSQFEIDFKKYCRYGIMMGAIVRTLAMTDKEDRRDFEDALDGGGSADFSNVFKIKIKNEKEYLAKMKAYVEYIVDNGLIQLDSCSR